MPQSIRDNSGHAILNVIKGVTYNLTLSNIVGYGDCTDYTWSGLVFVTTNGFPATTPTVTAPTANSVLMNLSATQLNTLTVGQKYSFWIEGVQGSTVVSPLMGSVVVKAKGSE